MKYKVSLPEDAKRDFFVTAGKPKILRGEEPIKVDLSAAERDTFKRKGLKVEALAKPKPKTEAKDSPEGE